MTLTPWEYLDSWQTGLAHASLLGGKLAWRQHSNMHNPAWAAGFKAYYIARGTLGPAPVIASDR